MTLGRRGFVATLTGGVAVGLAGGQPASGREFAAVGPGPGDARDAVSLGDFLPDGWVSGETDVTVAFQRALDQVAGSGAGVWLPAGDFVLTDTLRVPVTTLIGQGTGITRLLFRGLSGRDGLAFQPTGEVGREGGVVHLSLVADGAHGGAAIVTPRSAKIYQSSRTRYRFEHLEFRGGAPAARASGWGYHDGWRHCVDLGDCWGAYVDRIDAIGCFDITADPAGQPDHTFLRMSAEGGILSARVSHVTTHGVKRGIDIGDRCFFFLAHCDIAHSHEGIVSTGREVHGEGRIHDLLINAQKTGLHLANRSWTSVHDVAVARHKAGFDHGGDWRGLFLENMDKSWLSNIRVQADESLRRFSGSSTGFHLERCDGLTCNGLIPGLGLRQGVLLRDVSGSVFDSSNLQGTSGTGFSFQGNTRDCVVSDSVFSDGWTRYDLAPDIDPMRRRIDIRDRDRLQELVKSQGTELRQLRDALRELERRVEIPRRN
jgi:hypothetical protein